MSKELLLRIPTDTPELFALIESKGKTTFYTDCYYKNPYVQEYETVKLKIIIPENLVQLHLIQLPESALMPIGEISMALESIKKYKSSISKCLLFVDNREIDLEYSNGDINRNKINELYKPFWYKKWALLAITMNNKQIGVLYWIP